VLGDDASARGIAPELKILDGFGGRPRWFVRQPSMVITAVVNLTFDARPSRLARRDGRSRGRR
jgi:hypothetical protein